MSTTTGGASAPRTLDDLIVALQDLKALPPVDRARQIPDLIRACQTVLGHERGRAMAQATDPTGLNYMTQAQLAAVLGVRTNKVSDGIAAWRHHQAKETACDTD